MCVFLGSMYLTLGIVFWYNLRSRSNFDRRSCGLILDRVWIGHCYALGIVSCDTCVFVVIMIVCTTQQWMLGESQLVVLSC